MVVDPLPPTQTNRPWRRFDLLPPGKANLARFRFWSESTTGSREPEGTLSRNVSLIRIRCYLIASATFRVSRALEAMAAKSAAAEALTPEDGLGEPDVKVRIACE